MAAQSPSFDQSSGQPPARSAVVIVGAGIVGCSAAYHLTRLGWRDVVVLEQGPLFETGGSSSHAPGLIFQTNASRTMCHLAMETVRLYSSVLSELAELDVGATADAPPCFYPVGSLEVAYTPERWDDLHRKLGFARSWGLPAVLLSPEEARARLPLLDTSKIHGAYFVPSDGIAKAVRVAEALARIAQTRGASFRGNTRVTGVEVRDGRVEAVLTDGGRYPTERVLVCAGIWGPRVGRMAGVRIPLTPVEHQYVRTAPLAELGGETREVVHPILRHQDRAMYFRQHADCYGVGSYRHEPLLVRPDDIRPHEASPVMPSIVPFTEQHFGPAWEAAVDLLPALAGAELPYRINGMFSFTPDGLPVLGEAAEVHGFWSAEAVWVTHGGGVGKVIAEWMDSGHPGLDLRECDINRFETHALSRPYVEARGAQQYREVYDVIHPLQQMEQPRPLRVSPFQRRFEELGAVCFEGRGWERPQWFTANEGLVDQMEIPRREGWSARFWSPIIGVEHCATRERVALYDMTPLTKAELVGPGALAALDQLATNRVDRPVGSVTYTAMVDEQGGVRSDVTITRLGPQHFQLGLNGLIDLRWIRDHLPSDGSAYLRDTTSSICALGLWGPRARDVLQPLCDEDLSNAAFRYFTARRIFVGEVPVLALRLSYVGELGWELYAPSEYRLRLWDLLWQSGAAHGVIAAGRGAFDSLRLEKGYRLWGNDMHTEYNAYEAGLGFTVNLDKGPFIGRDALVRIKEQGLTRKLCCMTLDDQAAVMMGKEPIRDGTNVLGYVTSANYGYSVRKSIVYGYLPIDYAATGTQVQIEYFGRCYSATVSDEPLYDPKMARLKA